MSIKTYIDKIINKFNLLVHQYPKDCYIDIRSKIKQTGFEGKNKILKGTQLTECNIGKASFIGCNCSFVKTSIGRYCSIGEDVKLIYGNHPVNNIVSTYPAFYSAEAQYGFTYVNATLFSEFSYTAEGFLAEIGNDVWIGSSTRILSGIKIGDGAVIGANSLVTKDVPPYSVVMGVPAKCKRLRFREDQITELMKIRWWEKDELWLKKNAMLFRDIEEFLSAINDIQTS